MDVVGPMQLRLKSRARGALTDVSLTGTFSTEAASSRHTALLELLALFSQGPLHVVLCAGAQGGSAWTDVWTRGIDAADAPLTIEFRAPNDRRRPRRPDAK